ncbi:hypothetical protein FB446DRAFT_794821, partial [Lentinula raphanica]
GSGDVTPAAPEAKTSSPPTPAPSVRSPGPPAPPPSSQGSEHVFPAASEAKIQSSASPAPPPSSEGLGDASEAKMPSLPAPGPIVRSPGPPVSAHPSSSDAPQVLSAPLKPPQHTLRLSPPPDRPLWILPPPTTNLWEPNSKYFTLVDDTWYADESSLCPAGYVYREREGGFLRHDRGPTSPPLPSTTSRSLRDSDVIVIDDVEVNPVVASGSADHPIAIDVDIDGGVPMDVDPPQVSYSKNGGGSKGDGDYTMADLPSGQSVSNDNDDEDEEDEEDEDEDEGIAFDMTEEQHQLAEWIKDHHVPTWGPVPYHIYHVRCKRGFERTTVKRINDDIASETIPLNLIRAAFISQYPGGFYLQARSMLPGNTPLALYLNLIPNLIYPRGKRVSVRQGTLNNPPSTISQLREEWDQRGLGMPLHTLVDDLSGTEDSKRRFYANSFRPGTWVVPTKGRYRGDTGLVVFDDFDEIDESTESLVLFIPRPQFNINHPLYPNKFSHKPSKQAQPASEEVHDQNIPSVRDSRFELPDFEEAGFPLPVEPRIPKTTVSAKYRTGKRPLRVTFGFDFRKNVEVQWKSFCSLYPELKDVNFEARCSQQCETPFTCQHQPNYLKRFIFDKAVIRGGLALVRHQLSDLEMAESIDDLTLKTFTQYPVPDIHLDRLPPPRTWSFIVGETVIYVPEGSGLEEVKKGEEGIIQRDGLLECEVLFSHSQANVSILKRHLRKNWRLGQIVELSPHSPSVVLRTREQLGYSGVSTLNEDHFTPASQTGLITKVKLDQLDVWLTEINSICTVHPNSVREVPASADTSSQESVFQPKLTNLGATLALKPSLLAIQKIGNLDQKADLADFADSFITREVNRFDLRRSEHGVQSRTSTVTSVDEMISFLNPTIRSTLLGYIATEGTVPRTEYTGRIPWLHVEVKPITGERKGYLARVFDVKSDWKNTKSGLLVLIRFQNPSLIGNLDEWYDYDQLRRADNGGFIHESTFTKQISSYFNFRMGYIPRHREDELPVTDLSTQSADMDGSRTPKNHWTAVDYSVPAWDPSSRTPNPYASSSSSTMSTPPAKHWILDPRICKGLAGREIWVNVRSEKDPVRVSLHVGSSGEIEISCQDNHVGGSKVNVAQRSVDYRAILSNPRCSKVTKGHSASGLYIICEGEHTGKLVRRANYFAEGNLWVLQVMRSVFHPDRRKQFSVEVESDDRVLKRIPGNALAMVHEARSDSDAANKLMCIIRKAAGGNTNGYDVDGHGRIVKIGHA